MTYKTLETLTFRMAHQDIILTILEDEYGDIAEVKGVIPLLYREKGGYYFVHCPVFKTLGYSKKGYEEAEKDHRVDLKLFFKVHVTDKSLQSTLTSLGWRMVNDDHYDHKNIPHYLLDRAKNEEVHIAI